MEAELAGDGEAACANCGAPFLPQRRRFCPECGQETAIQPPRVVEFLQQFGGAYLSTEGALWRTLKLLLLQPGELTVRYLAGQRKHYVLPLRLYLTVSVVVLLMMRWGGGVEVVRGLDRPEFVSAERGDLPTVVLNVNPVSLGVRQGSFVCESLPQWLCSQVRERAAPDARTFLRKIRLANERLAANFGAVMFVLLPLFALCLKLVNARARMPYAAHLVFALHLHAFWFIVLPFMWDPFIWPCAAVMAFYTLKAGRRVYQGRWVSRTFRAVALTLLYMGLLALTIPVAWLLGLLL
jgi:Protein of unknown function (DUF3667)